MQDTAAAREISQAGVRAARLQNPFDNASEFAIIKMKTAAGRRPAARGGTALSLAKFYLITDTHYFENALGAYGPEYEKFMHYEQKCFAETEAINKAVFAALAEMQDADTVLIAGDLSFNGEIESHRGFLRLLAQLKAAGKRVFVVTADHDFKKPDGHCFAFNDTGRIEPEKTPRDQLFDLYYDYGFGDAIAVDRAHLSYVAQLAPGVRLLALNNDAGDRRCFDDAQRAWILEQAAKAKAEGQMLFAMNHYPLLAGQPILSIIGSATQKDAAEVVPLLADAGVHLVFTGHMHNQSINEYITPAGNKFYDVCTGAIIADPAVMRRVTIEDAKTVKIETVDIPDFAWDTGGRSCKQYLQDLFDQMIVHLLEDMEKDPPRVMRKLGIGDKKKLVPVVRFLGKRLNRLTLGGFCRLLWIKCDPSIKKVKLKAFAKDLVRHAFEGNQPWVAGTPEGDTFLRFLKRMRPVFKKIHVKAPDGSPADLGELLKHSAGNYGIDDYNATLILED